jgi:predicted HTH transcriptional regulator
LTDFGNLRRKAVRVIVYEGHGRTGGARREQEGGRGYAAGFEGLITYVNGLLPSSEVVGQALRKPVPVYPEPAIRELVANALIHQDLSITGAGPMVELFSDRMEITNPGTPLVDTQRLLDSPPPVAQRSTGLDDAAHRHLRRAWQRRRQGGVPD